MENRLKVDYKKNWHFGQNLDPFIIDSLRGKSKLGKKIDDEMTKWNFIFAQKTFSFNLISLIESMNLDKMV